MLKVIVPGGLNTDIIASGVNKIASRGELVVGKELKIGPGGKSRNVAQMIAALTGPGTVAMIGKTVRDPLGLWKVPYDALSAAGVDTTCVKVLEFSGTFPGVALIPVDTEGNNQIYLLPGVNNDFVAKDIDAAASLFEETGRQSGILALSLELPLPTALHALDKAEVCGLKAVVDPGGISESVDYQSLLRKKIFLLKPNEHEAEVLSGVKVSDLESARQAAKVLMGFGVENVLITAGKNGAYLITASTAEHLPIPTIDVASNERDETGCGDQAMAAICAFLSEGKSLAEAAKIGIIAGTLQFYKPGIVPVGKEELLRHIGALA